MASSSQVAADDADAIAALVATLPVPTVPSDPYALTTKLFLGVQLAIYARNTEEYTFEDHHTNDAAHQPEAVLPAAESPEPSVYNAVTDKYENPFIAWNQTKGLNATKVSRVAAPIAIKFTTERKSMPPKSADRKAAATRIADAFVSPTSLIDEDQARKLIQDFKDELPRADTEWKDASTGKVVVSLFEDHAASLTYGTQLHSQFGFQKIFDKIPKAYKDAYSQEQKMTYDQFGRPIQSKEMAFLVGTTTIEKMTTRNVFVRSGAFDSAPPVLMAERMYTRFVGAESLNRFSLNLKTPSGAAVEAAAAVRTVEFNARSYNQSVFDQNMKALGDVLKTSGSIPTNDFYVSIRYDIGMERGRGGFDVLIPHVFVDMASFASEVRPRSDDEEDSQPSRRQRTATAPDAQSMNTTSFHTSTALASTSVLRQFPDNLIEAEPAIPTNNTPLESSSWYDSLYPVGMTNASSPRIAEVMYAASIAQVPTNIVYASESRTDVITFASDQQLKPLWYTSDSPYVDFSRSPVVDLNQKGQYDTHQLSSTHHVAFVSVFDKGLLDGAIIELKREIINWIGVNKHYSMLKDVFHFGTDFYCKEFATPLDVDQAELSVDDKFVLPSLRKKNTKIHDEVKAFAHNKPIFRTDESWVDDLIMFGSMQNGEEQLTTRSTEWLQLFQQRKSDLKVSLKENFLVLAAKLYNTFVRPDHHTYLLMYVRACAIVHQKGVAILGYRTTASYMIAISLLRSIINLQDYKQKAQLASELLIEAVQVYALASDSEIGPPSTPSDSDSESEDGNRTNRQYIKFISTAMFPSSKDTRVNAALNILVGDKDFVFGSDAITNDSQLHQLKNDLIKHAKKSTEIHPKKSKVKPVGVNATGTDSEWNQLDHLDKLLSQVFQNATNKKTGIADYKTYYPSNCPYTQDVLKNGDVTMFLTLCHRNGHTKPMNAGLFDDIGSQPDSSTDPGPAAAAQQPGSPTDPGPAAASAEQPGSSTAPAAGSSTAPAAGSSTGPCPESPTTTEYTTIERSATRKGQLAAQFKFLAMVMFDQGTMAPDVVLANYEAGKGDRTSTGFLVMWYLRGLVDFYNNTVSGTKEWARWLGSEYAVIPNFEDGLRKQNIAFLVGKAHKSTRIKDILNVVLKFHEQCKKAEEVYFTFRDFYRTMPLNPQLSVLRAFQDAVRPSYEMPQAQPVPGSVVLPPQPGPAGVVLPPQPRPGGVLAPQPRPGSVLAPPQPGPGSVLAPPPPVPGSVLPPGPAGVVLAPPPQAGVVVVARPVPVPQQAADQEMGEPDATNTEAFFSMLQLDFIDTGPSVPAPTFSSPTLVTDMKFEYDLNQLITTHNILSQVAKNAVFKSYDSSAAHRFVNPSVNSGKIEDNSLQNYEFVQRRKALSRSATSISMFARFDWHNNDIRRLKHSLCTKDDAKLFTRDLNDNKMFKTQPQQDYGILNSDRLIPVTMDEHAYVQFGTRLSTNFSTRAEIPGPRCEPFRWVWIGSMQTSKMTEPVVTATKGSLRLASYLKMSTNWNSESPPPSMTCYNTTAVSNTTCDRLFFSNATLDKETFLRLYNAHPWAGTAVVSTTSMRMPTDLLNRFDYLKQYMPVSEFASYRYNMIHNRTNNALKRLSEARGIDDVITGANDKLGVLFQSFEPTQDHPDYVDESDVPSFGSLVNRQKEANFEFTTDIHFLRLYELYLAEKNEEFVPYSYDDYVCHFRSIHVRMSLLARSYMNDASFTKMNLPEVKNNITSIRSHITQLKQSLHALKLVLIVKGIDAKPDDGDDSLVRLKHITATKGLFNSTSLWSLDLMKASFGGDASYNQQFPADGKKRRILNSIDEQITHIQSDIDLTLGLTKEIQFVESCGKHLYANTRTSTRATKTTFMSVQKENIFGDSKVVQETIDTASQIRSSIKTKWKAPAASYTKKPLAVNWDTCTNSMPVSLGVLKPKGKETQQNLAPDWASNQLSSYKNKNMDYGLRLAYCLYLEKKAYQARNEKRKDDELPEDYAMCFSKWSDAHAKEEFLCAKLSALYDTTNAAVRLPTLYEILKARRQQIGQHLFTAPFDDIDNTFLPTDNDLKSDWMTSLITFSDTATKFLELRRDSGNVHPPLSMSATGPAEMNVNPIEFNPLFVNRPAYAVEQVISEKQDQSNDAYTGMNVQTNKTRISEALMKSLRLVLQQPEDNSAFLRILKRIPESVDDLIPADDDDELRRYVERDVNGLF